MRKRYENIIVRLTFADLEIELFMCLASRKCFFNAGNRFPSRTHLLSKYGSNTVYPCKKMSRVVVLQMLQCFDLQFIYTMQQVRIFL